MESYIVLLLLFAVSGSLAEGDLAVIENDPPYPPPPKPIIDVCVDMFGGTCMKTPCPPGYVEPTCYKRFKGSDALVNQQLCDESCCVPLSNVQICTNVSGGYCNETCNSTGLTHIQASGLDLCNGNPPGDVCCVENVTRDYCESWSGNVTYCAETCDEGHSSINPDPLSPLCDQPNKTCCLKNDRAIFCKKNGGSCRSKCNKNELTLTEPNAGFELCDGAVGGNVCCIVESDIIKSAPIKIPKECSEKPYRKYGCFSESKTWEQQFSLRRGSGIDWAGWNSTYLEEMSCKCSKKAWDKKHDYFAIRYYGICLTSDTRPLTTFMSNCVDGNFTKCDLTGDTLIQSCVGASHSDFVYIRVSPPEEP